MIDCCIWLVVLFESVITVSQFVHQVIHYPKNWIIIIIIIVVVVNDKTRRMCVEIPLQVCEKLLKLKEDLFNNIKWAGGL
jgi:hypothetical protein